MKLRKTAAMLALALGVTGVQLGVSPAHAGPPDEREVWEMLIRSAMMRADRKVGKADFLRLMEKRFDSMDKGSSGALSPGEVAKILDPNYDAR